MVLASFTMVVAHSHLHYQQSPRYLNSILGLAHQQQICTAILKQRNHLAPVLSSTGLLRSLICPVVKIPCSLHVLAILSETIFWCFVIAMALVAPLIARR